MEGSITEQFPGAIAQPRFLGTQCEQLIAIFRVPDKVLYQAGNEIRTIQVGLRLHAIEQAGHLYPDAITQQIIDLEETFINLWMALRNVVSMLIQETENRRRLAFTQLFHQRTSISLIQ